MQNDLNKPLHLHISVGAIVGVTAEASPHKRRLKCDTNISPRRLITHLLHQMVHHVQLYAVMGNEAPLLQGQELKPKQEREPRRGHQSLAPYETSCG